MHSFDLSFEDFFVPDANVVGGEAGLGKGFYFTMAGMVGGRMQTAARACGVMRAALRAAIRYTADRKVFGAPLVDFPLTQAKLARMGARLAACRQLAYAVAGMVDRGEGRMEASLVKLLACRSAELVTREALQMHGGMGYAEETRGEPLLRRCARAVDLRGRRGDAGAQGGRAQPAGTRARQLGERRPEPWRRQASSPACAWSRPPPSSRRRWAA